MSSLPIVVYGAGGHGRVVAEVVQSMGLQIDGFIDDGLEAGRAVLGELKVLGDQSWLRAHSPICVALAIGDNRRREAVATALESMGLGLVLGTFIHSRAWVSPTAQLGAGTVVMAQAAVNAGARVGRGVILNTGCVVEHDVAIGDFAHVSPRAALGGGAAVGARSHIGIGASLLHLAAVGDDCVIGGGAVVLKRIESGVTAVGVPARKL